MIFYAKQIQKCFIQIANKKHLWNWFFMTFSFPNSEKSKFWSNKKVCILLKIIQDLSLFLFTSKREEQYYTKVDFGIPLIFNTFVYQKTIIQTFHSSFLTTNCLCEFTTREYKFNRWFCTQKLVLYVQFKDFSYTKTNLTQIWYDKFN